jgi:hypothetical protein
VALITAVAGRYSGTYDPPGAIAATDLGVQDAGYDLEAQHAAEVIEQSDAYAKTPIELVSQGITNCFLTFECLEWKVGPLLAAFPYGALPVAPTGATFLSPGVIGQLGSAVAGVVVLTATAGTPAAAAPASLTATQAVIAENHPVKWKKSSVLRRIPLRLRLLPYLDTVIKFWAAT